MKHILSILCVALITGCTASYQQSELTEPTVKLDPSKAVTIATPDDGWYEDKEYKNSGQMTASAVRAEFAKHATQTDISETCAQVDCVDAQTYGYLVVPTILHWEDRVTEWSGKADRLEIQLQVYDVASGTEIANATLQGKSKWATFGGDHPQDLLEAPVTEYVAALYE